MGVKNPFRYRGYVWDAETELYYLGSRYYDAKVGRFLNADDIDIIDVQDDLYDKNLYLYCDNNPIKRKDIKGDIWETIFDIVSLGTSIVEVAINPGDPWAWAGLVGDAVDLLPFVTGVGETTRAINSTTKLLKQTNDVVDHAKSLRKTVGSSVGTYEILYASGRNYVGKGSFSRAIHSAEIHAKPNKMNNNMGDVVTSISWKTTNHDANKAFIEEYALQTRRGVGDFSKIYNKIWSPGKKRYEVQRRRVI